MTAARRPDVEFRREISPGAYVTYGHIYWRPLIVHVFGRTIIGKKCLKRSWDQRGQARNE